MHILFLGPPCQKLEDHMLKMGHTYTRTEEPIIYTWLQENYFDFGISYKYWPIIKKQEINFFSGNLINLHISYLPWNRGLSPNLWSFLTQTPSGVSIHLIDEGIDTGRILLRKQVPYNLQTDTLATSYERLNTAILDLLINNFFQIISGKIEPFIPQEQGSYHSLKDKEEYQFLLQEKGWETPIAKLMGKASK